MCHLAGDPAIRLELKLVHATRPLRLSRPPAAGTGSCTRAVSTTPEASPSQPRPRLPHSVIPESSSLPPGPAVPRRSTARPNPACRVRCVAQALRLTGMSATVANHAGGCRPGSMGSSPPLGHQRARAAGAGCRLESQRGCLPPVRARVHRRPSSRRRHRGRQSPAVQKSSASDTPFTVAPKSRFIPFGIS